MSLSTFDEMVGAMRIPAKRKGGAEPTAIERWREWARLRKEYLAFDLARRAGPSRSDDEYNALLEPEEEARHAVLEAPTASLADIAAKLDVALDAGMAGGEYLDDLGEAAAALIEAIGRQLPEFEFTSLTYPTDEVRQLLTGRYRSAPEGDDLAAALRARLQL